MDVLDEGSAKVVESYLRGGKRFLPVKAALLRLLFCKKQVSKDDPYLNKSLLAKLLFEGQLGHLNSYLKENPVVEVHSSQSTFYKIKNFEEMPNDIIQHGISDSFFVQYLTYWESQILDKSDQYKINIKSIENFVALGLKTILDKYAEFFRKLSPELDEIAKSIRDRKFDTSLAYKIVEYLIPTKVSVEARLILDALAYSSFCLVWGHKLKQDYNIMEETDFHPTEVISKIAELLMKSQGEDGGWALRNYDRALIVKDTGLILYLLKEIKETFPSVIIDKKKIEKSASFLLDVMNELEKKKKSTVKLETEYLLQVDLYTTVQMIAGLYSANKLLGNDERQTFEQPFVKRFFKYLGTLESNGGYSLDKENKPDVETTSFIANTMIGQNSFAFSNEELKKLTDGRFNALGTINYFYNNKKAIEDFLNKAHHLNVVADCSSALLWCGIWPLSSYLMDSLVTTCKKATKSIENFKKIPLFETKNGELRLTLVLSPMYWKTMSSVNALHQTILCLMVMHNYLKNPDDYWSKVNHLLTDS